MSRQNERSNQPQAVQGLSPNGLLIDEPLPLVEARMMAAQLNNRVANHVRIPPQEIGARWIPPPPTPWPSTTGISTDHIADAASYQIPRTPAMSEMQLKTQLAALSNCGNQLRNLISCRDEMNADSHQLDTYGEIRVNIGTKKFILNFTDFQEDQLSQIYEVINEAVDATIKKLTEEIKQKKREMHAAVEEI